MDADLSHDEKILPELIASVAQGADLAVGSRWIGEGGAKDWPWYRRLASHGASHVVRTLLKIRLTDPMSGYFVLSQRLYQECRAALKPTGFKILTEICVKARPQSIKEIPYVFINRRQGHSKVTLKVIWQFVRMVARLSCEC
jgi:dolichol-phosphate mannosyltransferase